MTDIKHIDRDELQKWLTEMELEPVVDSEGRLYIYLPADLEFPHDVVFHFTHDDSGWFGIEAIADGFELVEDDMALALAIANDFSRKARIPKVFVRNNRFKIDQWNIFPSGTTPEFIRDYIEMVISISWRFFVEAYKGIKFK